MADSLGTCWSTRQQMSNAGRDARVHLQGEGTRTLCGVATSEDWEYDYLDTASIGEAAEQIGCRKCRRMAKALAAKDGGLL
jgi:hypothetical protein